MALAGKQAGILNDPCRTGIAVDLSQIKGRQRGDGHENMGIKAMPRPVQMHCTSRRPWLVALAAGGRLDLPDVDVVPADGRGDQQGATGIELQHQQWTLMRSAQHEIWNHYQNSSKAHAKVPQNLIVPATSPPVSCYKEWPHQNPNNSCMSSWKLCSLTQWLRHQTPCQHTQVPAD